jgi:oligo-1,6-glucosidase
MQLDADPAGGPSRRSLKPWRLPDLKNVMTRWQKDLENRGWNSLYLTNHDQPRAVSRFGDDGQYRIESAKLLATFTLLLQGTPYIYQGEEIGMTNVAFASIADYRDIETLNIYHELVEEKGLDPQAALAIIHAKSRDNARTPLQWDDGDHGGFTTGAPWIRLNPNYRTINVKQALADPESIFYYVQKLIQLRKANPIIVYGTYDLILDTHKEIYAFTRTLEDDRLLVILNFTKHTPSFTLPAHLTFVDQDLLISNYTVNPDESLCQFTLRPFEARVYRLR